MRELTFVKKKSFILLLKKLCVFVFFCVVFVHIKCKCRGVQNMASDPPELKLQAVLSWEPNSVHLHEQ